MLRECCLNVTWYLCSDPYICAFLFFQYAIVSKYISPHQVNIFVYTTCIILFCITYFNLYYFIVLLTLLFLLIHFLYYFLDKHILYLVARVREVDNCSLWQLVASNNWSPVVTQEQLSCAAF